MEQLDINQFGGSLTIRWRWYRAMAWFLLVFAAFWNGFLLLFAALSPDGLPWLIIFHVLAGVFVAYYALALFLNRTTIEVGNSRLKVRKGPLPWGKNRNIATNELEQLFAIEAGSEGKGSSRKPLYQLRATLRGGKVITLVSNIRSKDIALELEQRIEAHLGITDVAVELPPSSVERFIEEKFPGMPIPSLPGPINEGKPGASSSADVSTSRRIAPRANKSDRVGLATLSEGESFHLQHAPLRLESRTQLDWDNGLTDYALRALNAQGETVTVYVEESQGRWLYFEERALGREEYESFGITAGGPAPTSFTNGDDKFYQRDETPGVVHSPQRGSVAGRQWIYFTTGSDTRFRVLDLGGEPAVFIQETVSADNFRLDQ